MHSSIRQVKVVTEMGTIVKFTTLDRMYVDFILSQTQA